MEPNDKKGKKNQEQTPIIDGDARPDINIHGDERTAQKDHPIETPRDRKKRTTENRKDTNSLEDFKDARQE
jgi:hypothetical protein